MIPKGEIYYNHHSPLTILQNPTTGNSRKASELIKPCVIREKEITSKEKIKITHSLQGDKNPHVGGCN